jgi:LysB family phage lysis regulatory protein
MTTLRQALYGLALLGALALLLWGQYQHSQAEQGRTALAEARLQLLQARSDRQSQSIIRLGGEVHAQRLGLHSLQEALDSLRRAQAADQLKKKEQRREDPIHQGWADQPLPDAARRLHQRPAITGADSYRRWLSDRHSVQSGTGGADQ